MARRARQKRRRAQNPGPRPTQPHRDSVPGSLDHASGQIEEFEAGIVAGADGVPADAIDDEELSAEAVDAAEDVEAPPAARRAAGIGTPTAHEPVAARGGNRVIGFLRACWAELQRVQWPDRRQVGQATAVVIGFVAIAGAYLGIADWAAQKVIDFIL